MRGILIVGIVLMAGSPGRAAEITLVPATATEAAAIEVVQLPKDALVALTAAQLTPKQWPAIVRVVVAGGTAAELAARQPVAGTHRLTPNGIRFEPQFPLAPGQRYVVTYSLNGLRGLPGEALTAEVGLPKLPPGPRVSVAAVYPSAMFLPENTLRLYIQFTGPVTRGDIYRHFTLTRSDGKLIEFPFLDLDEELWSVDGTRLTLLFHPGRVKRGLKPREDDGPILEEGKRYTFAIDKNWEDREGRPLVAGFQKAIVAGPPDDQPVDPDAWSLMAPAAGSDRPLILRFAEPLDHALLGRMLWVVDANGKTVPGTVSVGGGERVVSFTPVELWKPGNYRLVVDRRLEDVCGNRVGEPFEIDVFRPIVRDFQKQTVERPFRVR